ncbi:MAG: hypothetical protein GX811_11945, partial [Lentisphaerae bacterium]|nr:hypothetical protein [Lentisphaerota bacterium]
MNINNRFLYPLILFFLLLCLSNAGAATKTWTGSGANALASTPANWSDNAVPADGDDIVLDSPSTKDMTWDLDINIQTWIQDGYEGTVTVATVFSPDGFSNLNILGNCTIKSGTWTHQGAQQNEINRLSVSVGGNLEIGTYGKINVAGKGYATGKGPGGTSGVNGGSYGGRGHAASKPCYGSIMAPTNIGSGGGYGSGGGAIRLAITGQLIHNGLINAESMTIGYPTGAGGSIWLTFASLHGDGTINANGLTGAGGGRISLTATEPGYDFSEFTGVISAKGGSSTSYKGAGGTIYLENESDGFGKGRVIVEASGGSGSNYTDFNADVKETVFHKLIFREGGHFALGSNHLIEVSGVWSNLAMFTGLPGATVSFTDRYQDTSSIYGGGFVNLVATN